MNKLSEREEQEKLDKQYDLVYSEIYKKIYHHTGVEPDDTMAYELAMNIVHTLNEHNNEVRSNVEN